MQDWKGNKIEVGQTVLIVNVKSMFGGCKSQFTIMTENGLQNVGGEIISPESHQWNIVSEANITPPSANATISIFTGEGASEIPINQIDLWLSVQPWQILCIEGVSDNCEDYGRAFCPAQH